jgi:hypothetical protein
MILKGLELGAISQPLPKVGSVIFRYYLKSSLAIVRSIEPRRASCKPAFLNSESVFIFVQFSWYNEIRISEIM